ncbi:hypothetical protein YPPY12_1922, partial [Yersinia pestis PY-12]
MLIDMLILKRF